MIFLKIYLLINFIYKTIFSIRKHARNMCGIIHCVSLKEERCNWMLFWENYNSKYNCVKYTFFWTAIIQLTEAKLQLFLTCACHFMIKKEKKNAYVTNLFKTSY